MQYIQILNHVYLKLISCYMLLIIFPLQKDRRTHLETLQGGPGEGELICSHSCGWGRGVGVEAGGVGPGASGSWLIGKWMGQRLGACGLSPWVVFAALTGP